MIEKLKLHQVLDNNGKVYAEVEPDNTELREAINELIDMTNRLHIEINNHDCRLLSVESQIWDNNEKKTEPADPFAEQKKWIGKLCRFWDDEGDSHFSILVDIHKPAPYPYCCEGDWWYQHCEPVKSDDSIVYKGE